MSKFLKILCKSTFLLPFLSMSIVEAVWSPPERISAISSDVSVDMDAKGNAMAVWNGSYATTANNIYYNYMVKGNNWYAALPLSSAEKRAIMSPPQIAVDDNSNTIVVWEEFNEAKNKTTSIKVAMLPAGGKWTFQEISKSKGAGRFPQIAINSSGYAVAVWQNWNQKQEFPKVIQASILQFGGNWSEPIDISSGERPQVCVDNAGNAVAIWYDQGTIKSASLPYNGTWSSPSVLGTGEEFAIAMNSSGYAVAVWYERLSVNASTMQFGENWSPSVKLFVRPDNIINTAKPSVAVGSAGNAIVAWQDETLNKSVAFPFIDDTFVLSSYLPFGGSWTAPVRISPQDQPGFNPQIALDGKGNALAAWNTHTSIQVAMRPFGENWLPYQIISGEGENSKPCVAMDSTGYAVVCWINSFGHIQGAKWEP